MRIRLSPAGVALVYAAIAGGWIVLSHVFLVVEADPAHQGWIEIGKGHLQQGFMALTRAVARPAGF